MNTQSWPSRGSIAQRGAHGADARLPLRCRRPAARRGAAAAAMHARLSRRQRRRGPRTDRAGRRADSSSGAHPGQRAERQAEATGESPGTRNSLPRRESPSARCTQRAAVAACQRWIGSTKPTGVVEAALEHRRRRARSIGSSSLLSVGSTFTGSVAFRATVRRDPRRPAARVARSRPSCSARPGHEALGMPSACAAPAALVGDQRRRRPTAAGRPCASSSRTPSAAAARPDTICPGRNAAARPARTRRAAAGSSSSAQRRLVGPTAAVFHSAPSMSSIETKVGSPPMVSRTSPALELARRLRAPSASMRRPLLVAVGLGDARLSRGCARRSSSKPNSTSRGSTDAGDRRAPRRLRRRRRAGCGLRRRAGPRSDRARSSRRPAGRPRPRRAGR